MEYRELSLSKEKLKYKIIRRVMKSIRINIDGKGEVSVSAPKRTTLKEIERIVADNSLWIEKKREEINKKIKKTTFLDDCEIEILGRKFYVEIFEGRNRISVEDNIITLYSMEQDDEYIKSMMEKWLKEKARILFQERTEKYGKILGVKPNRIAIKDQKRVWGSCSSKGNINLNWRLILAAIEIVDYVVCHELCHMIHMNHSQEFWNLVESVVPEYAKKRKWLKENGGNLFI